MDAGAIGDVRRFLSQQKLTVIATGVRPGKAPESALVAFWETEDLELYFQTHAQSRKAVNLRENPHCSFVFGLTEDDRETVQYEGMAAEILSESERSACTKGFEAKESPTASAKYLRRPDVTYFKVRPVWIGHTDYRSEPVRVRELTAF